MRACSPLLVLGSLLVAASGCGHRTHTDYGSHAEPAMETKLVLTPERSVMRLRVEVEPQWPDQPELRRGQWTGSDSMHAYANLQWINLGPDPAPSVVELRILGEEASEPHAVLVPANVRNTPTVSANLDFDFERCGTPCVIDLELTWHHAPSGELRIDWNVTANHSAYREDPSASYSLAYRVAPVEATSQSLAATVAVPPVLASDEPAPVTAEPAEAPTAPQ